ncbi:ABC transporter permease [Yoonia litorea]|uniref:Nucleoside ABC transporter membrane protein n=1 Tax=Yoonia litorea TaxID=1123755 RepID=A0A1I6MDS3_9RHOB|nr:ABC transporter permease [Yoonia litorea]SFS13900.1 nucleoside ABC transporter membrane protein [Yoonia litorea]
MTIVEFFQTLLTASFFAAILRAATPMVFAALGGLISELAGVINVALEGMMLIAAFFGVVGSTWAASVWPEASPLFFALVGAAAGLGAAMLLALVLAVFYLEFDANLIIAGVGINILAAGLTVFLLFSISGDKGSSAGLTSFALPTLPLRLLQDIPVIGGLFAGANGNGHHVLVYAALLAIGLVWVFLHKTRLGLRLRAVGENPDACRTVGVPVKRIQYVAILLSGFLAGLGGIYLSMGYLTLFQANMTAGRGFLALAAIFLGARSVFGTAGAAAFFGLASVFAAQLGLLDVPTAVVFSVAPLVTILALLAFAWRRQRRTRAQVAAELITLNARRKDTPDAQA